MSGNRSAACRRASSTVLNTIGSAGPPCSPTGIRCQRPLTLEMERRVFSVVKLALLVSTSLVGHASFREHAERHSRRASVPLAPASALLQRVELRPADVIEHADLAVQDAARGQGGQGGDQFGKPRGRVRALARAQLHRAISVAGAGGQPVPVILDFGQPETLCRHGLALDSQHRGNFGQVGRGRVFGHSDSLPAPESSASPDLFFIPRYLLLGLQTGKVGRNGHSS